MSENLIVNPFLEIHVDSEKEADFLLLAPKKDVGLQIVSIDKNQDAKLLNLIQQYSTIGLENLAVEKEFSASEIETLKRDAIVISDSEKPVKPLFSCQLEDVGIDDEEKDIHDLIVNPTFRFEPMNLATFKEWIYQKHFSPNQATGWIKNPVTKIDLGYWLTDEQAKVLSNLKSGGQIPADIDEQLLTKLISAKIAVSRKQFEIDTDRWESKVETRRTHFDEMRYVTLSDLLPQTQMKAMQKFYKDYISQGFMQFGDEFVNRRYRQHNEPLARFFHRNFTDLMSLVTKNEVIPSYCYAASYKGGAELTPHTDREQCEFSISFQVDYEPPRADETSPWDLFLATPKTLFEEKVKFEWDEFHNDPDLSGNQASIQLKNGDGLFYKGRDLIHYREKLPDDHRSTSLFFHYVPQNFTGDLR